MTPVENQTEIEEIEIQIDAAKELVAMADKVLALKNDPVFKEIILEQFCEDFAMNCLRMSTSLAVQENVRAQIERDMHAPSSLLRFLDGVLAQGNSARNSIETYNYQMEQIQDEG